MLQAGERSNINVIAGLPTCKMCYYKLSRYFRFCKTIVKRTLECVENGLRFLVGTGRIFWSNIAVFIDDG